MKSNYIFRKTTEIHQELKKQCDALYHNCCTSDTLKHPCCFEDEFDVFTNYPRLYYVFLGENLLGFLSTYIIDNNSVEICMFVHPNYRDRKIGTKLLHSFLADYNMSNIEVSIHPKNKLGIKFLNKNHFSPVSTELLMNLQLQSFLPKKIYSSALKKDFSSNHFKYMIRNECVGSCSISFLSDTCICVSGVKIFPKHQNKGLGYQFMLEILQEMALYFNDAILHVSKENIPAFKLYKKLGFQEVDSTLIYSLKHTF